MVYCIIHRISYSSSINIFAIGAGILLCRGGLKTARWVRIFSALFLVFLSEYLLLTPVIQPLDFLAAQLRVNPSAFLISIGFQVSFLVFCAWIFQQLGLPEVSKAQETAGVASGIPRFFFVLGAIAPVIIAAVFAYLPRTSLNAKALGLAQAQVGPGYKFRLVAFNVTGDHGQASVIAYSDRVIRPLHVEW